MRQIPLLGLVFLLSVGLGAQGQAPSPVADAAARGDKATVQKLLKDGADVNAAQGDGMSALHWAADRGDAELAEILIYAGANVTATTRIEAERERLLASACDRFRWASS